MPPHDFINFPELTNAQMIHYYSQSPHKQITADFRAEVIRVHDGDTITVRTSFRDFDFPIRFIGTNAKELGEGGEEAGDFLRDIILNTEIEILIDKDNRVGKYGRLLGKIISKGLDINELMIRSGHSTSFKNRNQGKIPPASKEFNLKKWF